MGGPDLLSVTALDTDCAWAVGDGGTIRKWGGTQWESVPVPGVTAGFLCATALDMDHVYAGSVSGQVFFFNGTTWRTIQTSATRDLASVAAVDTDHIYFAAGAGTFVWGYSTLVSQASKYYFAEGTCRPGFDPYICVQNPDYSLAVEVKITYMLGDGRTKQQRISVGPVSRATVSVRDLLGSGDDASTISLLRSNARVGCPSSSSDRCTSRTRWSQEPGLQGAAMSSGRSTLSPTTTSRRVHAGRRSTPTYAY